MLIIIIIITIAAKIIIEKAGEESNFNYYMQIMVSGMGVKDHQQYIRI